MPQRSTHLQASHRPTRGSVWLTATTSFVIAAAWLGVAGAFEAAEAKPEAPLQTDRDERDSARLDPAEEKEALQFVREHHAELARLLPQLKRSSPREYRSAVNDLYKTSRRLAARAERHPPRYQSELKAWKLQSRIDVLVARLSMSQSKELVAELRGLLEDEAALRREMLVEEQQRALERARQLEQTIANMKARQDEQVEQELSRLLRRAGHRPPVKNGEPSQQAKKPVGNSQGEEASPSPTTPKKKNPQ